MKYLILVINLFFSLILSAQDRIKQYETLLDELSKTTPSLNDKVELSIDNLPLYEFIRGIAASNDLNVSVDQNLKLPVSNNFSNITVKEILLFLCKKYDLEMTFTGSIISFTQFQLPPLEPKSKILNIKYDEKNSLISYDLKEDSIALVAKEISKLANTNIIISPALSVRLVKGFIQNLPLENALEKLALSNDFKINKLEDGTFLIDKKDEENISTLTAKKNNSKSNNSNVLNNTEGIFEYKIDGDFISAEIANKSISEVILKLSSEMKKNYYVFMEPKGSATLKLESVNFDDFLTLLLNGTDFTFKKDGEIYLIGDRSMEGLRSTKVIQLQNRTIEKLVDYIPSELKKGIEIKPFPDLNSLILSGSSPRIAELEVFIREVDKVVPVVMIEVIIVDVSKTKTLSAGVEVGLGENTNKSKKILPDYNYALDANSINSIINSFNGFGVFNLGRVTSNFYINLKALEANGVLKTRSTPKLATLNGNEAKLSIGNTEYYLEITNNLVGAQNPISQNSQQYKSVNADLSITINPLVSGDDQITLNVKVQQSNFTARISENAPPGLVKRDFQSIIRVKNEEMIILGGLEEDSSQDAGSGLPFLSRIPVIKWFFSSRTKSTDKSKLNIFIKPTVIY